MDEQEQEQQQQAEDSITIDSLKELLKEMKDTNEKMANDIIELKKTNARLSALADLSKKEEKSTNELLWDMFSKNK